MTFLGLFTNEFSDEDIRKPCHKIESSITTVLSLHRKSSDCKYRIETFSNRNCLFENYAEELPMNAETPFVKLNNWENRIPVCSFKIEFAYSRFMSVKFLQRNHNDKQNDMYESGCYNLCADDGSNFYYPYTIQLRYQKGRIAKNYVQLFSRPQCDEDDAFKYQNGTIKKVKDGANLVALTSESEVLSYRIFPAHTETVYNFK